MILNTDEDKWNAAVVRLCLKLAQRLAMTGILWETYHVSSCVAL